MLPRAVVILPSLVLAEQAAGYPALYHYLKINRPAAFPKVVDLKPGGHSP